MVDLERALSRIQKSMGEVRSFTSSGAVRAAIALVDDLRDMTREQRTLTVKNRPRYHSVAVAARILEVARDAAAESPDEGLAWLSLFDILALEKMEKESEVEATILEGLAAKATIQRAVTLTKKSDYLRAELVLRTAAHLEIVDPETAGEYHEARALLLTLQQKLPEALREIESAKAIYREIDDPHLLGRAIAAEAFAYGDNRQYGKAVELWIVACESIDARRDHRLTLAACFNLARCLRDAGRLSESLTAIAMSKDFFQQYARRTDRHHLLWLEAGVLADCGRFAAATESYLEVIESYAADGLPLSVAAATLEATEAFAKVHRLREIVPLIATAVEIFRSLRLEDEAIAAWVALREAAVRATVTTALIESARSAIAARA